MPAQGWQDQGGVRYREKELRQHEAAQVTGAFRENQVNRLRVGLIGCGAAASWHASVLAGMDEVQVVGLVEPNEANLERMRKRVPSLANAPAFAESGELYRAVEVDAVTIVTPHTLHYPQILEALEHGAHVLVEKPMVCDPAHAREIEARASASGLTVMVNYQRRLDPAYNYVRDAIANGDIGELRTVSINCGQSWDKYTREGWRQVPELSGGGMLMDTGSHMVHVLLWLADQQPARVTARVDYLGRPVDINSYTTITFADGAQGQLTVLGDLPATWIESVFVAGTEGVLRYENDPTRPWGTGHVHHYKDGGIVEPLSLEWRTSAEPVWVQVIRGEAENPTPPSMAVRVAELTAAIYRSAEEGRTLDLAEAVAS